MDCICCKKSSTPIDSHIISKFIRDRLTGIENGSKTKFEFRWSNVTRATQDLLKRELMCRTCDNEAGSVIESLAARLLIPTDPTSQSSWESLPIREENLIDIGNEPLCGGVYKYANSKENHCIAAFALLTAWRSLHAMALDGVVPAVNFLNSNEGAAINQEIASYFHLVHTSKTIETPPSPTAHLYYFGPWSASVITGKEDEMPFAWAFLEKDGPLGIGVVLGYWVILWPFFDESNDPKKTATLKEMCFFHWHAQIRGFFLTSDRK